MAAVLDTPPLSAPTRPASPWRRARRKLLQRRPAVVGMVIVLAFIVLALAAPWIAPHDPVATSWGAIRKAPSAAQRKYSDGNNTLYLDRQMAFVEMGMKAYARACQSETPLPEQAIENRPLFGKDPWWR